MNASDFPATAWNNGQWSPTGAGYGLKIPIGDRNRHFRREWHTVTLRLIGERTRRVAVANVAKASFWDHACRELIQAEIGRWLIENKLAVWPRGRPPRFRIAPIATGEFEVRPVLA